MITLELLPSVKDALSKLPYGRFSILHLGLVCYSEMTGPQASVVSQTDFKICPHGVHKGTEI
jgi:hypothetical protein